MTPTEVSVPATEFPDYYEFLEISPQATQETISRVYRFLAARYHPDHATGNLEKFAQLTAAYKVLSDPARRAEYNAQRAKHRAAVREPLSNTVDFMDQVQGDLNRRLAVLTILYYRRRMYPHNPEVTLAEIEERMGFPRDYLDFTIWYLTKKRYITRADNAELTLTVEGVDFIETQRTAVPLLEKLLTNGTPTAENGNGTQPAQKEAPRHPPAPEPPAADTEPAEEPPVEAPADDLVPQL